MIEVIALTAALFVGTTEQVYEPGCEGWDGYVGGFTKLGSGQASTHVLGNGSRTLWIGDVNGDGESEVVSLGMAAAPVLPGFEIRAHDLLTGEKLSGYGGLLPFGMTMSARRLVGDMNGDGKPEVVVEIRYPYLSTLVTTAFISMATGTAIEHIDDLAGGVFGVASPGDIDGDGIPDLIISKSGKLMAYRFEPSPLVQGSVLYEAEGSGLGGLVPFWDIDGDGLVELYAGNSRVVNPATLQVTQLANPIPGGDMIPGDVNGDGVPDICVGCEIFFQFNSPGGPASMYSGADGSFLYQGGGPVQLQRDYDGDGIRDLLGWNKLYSAADGTVLSVLFDPTLYEHGPHAEPGNLYSMPDFNGDGYDDFYSGSGDFSGIWTPLEPHVVDAGGSCQGARLVVTGCLAVTKKIGFRIDAPGSANSVALLALGAATQDPASVGCGCALTVAGPLVWTAALPLSPSGHFQAPEVVAHPSLAGTSFAMQAFAAAPGTCGQLASTNGVSIYIP